MVQRLKVLQKHLTFFVRNIVWTLSTRIESRSTIHPLRISQHSIHFESRISPSGEFIPDTSSSNKHQIDSTRPNRSFAVKFVEVPDIKMPRPPVENWGSSPLHLLDDILRSVESLGTYEGLVGFGEHLLKNPLIVGFFLLIFKVFWTFRKAVPELKGHQVRSIKSPDEWNATLKDAKLKKKIVVCHFYAAWAPTCKQAGRIFQRMSIDYIGGNTMFCRVDIKEIPSLKYTFDIECTPTFKILIAEQQIETMSGWSNDGLRFMMERNGCKNASKIHRNDAVMKDEKNVEIVEETTVENKKTK